MNHRNNTIREIQDLMNIHPSYSLGEVLYTISRELKIKKPSELLEKTDEEIYTAVNKAKETERDTEVNDFEFSRWVEIKNLN